MKNCNHILKLLSVLFIVVVFASCEKEYVPVAAPPVGDVSYSSDIQPFFDADCIGCHPSVWKPDLSVANSYNDLITGNYIDTTNPTNSLLYTKIKDGGSMATYTSTGKADLTLLWIEQGAKNN